MKLSNLFRLFRSSPKQVPQQSHSALTGEYIPCFWEDDYCQVELVPIENRPFIQAQLKQINNLAATAADGNGGFTEVFERGNMPVPTASKDFLADPFATGLGLPQARIIQYGPQDYRDTETTITKAFGFHDFTLFFDTTDQVYIFNMWIHRGVAISPDHIDQLTSVLYNMGESYELLLVDWNSLELIDLTDLNQIRQYLKH